MVPGCVHVYEIEPLGSVEPDDSRDGDAPAVRMPRARVLRLVDPFDKPVFDADPIAE